MKILCIPHTDFDLAPHVVLWMQKKEFNLSYCRPFKGEILPTIDDFDWLILMGGTQCLLELDRYPFIIDEIRLVKQAIAANKIVLGFCLGAQIIGWSYDKKTERSPHTEIGIFPIDLTLEGKKDPLMKELPASFSVVHWHRYMPGVPETAKILATSQGCPRQIIRFSPKTYGFQCHPEVSFQNVQKAISLFEEDLCPGPYIQSKEQFLKGDFLSINNIMISILNNLITLIH